MGTVRVESTDPLFGANHFGVIYAGFALGSDETIYFAPKAMQIHQLKGGVISVKGGQAGIQGFEGDGGPALQAKFDLINGLAAAPD